MCRRYYSKYNTGSYTSSAQVLSNSNKYSNSASTWWPYGVASTVHSMWSLWGLSSFRTLIKTWFDIFLFSFLRLIFCFMKYLFFIYLSIQQSNPKNPSAITIILIQRREKSFTIRWRTREYTVTNHQFTAVIKGWQARKSSKRFLKMHGLVFQESENGLEQNVNSNLLLSRFAFKKLFNLHAPFLFQLSKYS